jgi:hypothetical protein
MRAAAGLHSKMRPSIVVRKTPGQVALKQEPVTPFRLANSFLDLLPLCDIHESHNRTDFLSFLEYGLGPVFGCEAGAVAAPDDFVIDVRAMSEAKSFIDVALLHGVMRSVGLVWCITACIFFPYSSAGSS